MGMALIEDKVLKRLKKVKAKFKKKYPEKRITYSLIINEALNHLEKDKKWIA